MPKCRERSCPFPALFGELCRQHHDDSKALASIMPSTMVILVKDPAGFMRGDWGWYQQHDR